MWVGCLGVRCTVRQAAGVDAEVEELQRSSGVARALAGVRRNPASSILSVYATTGNHIQSHRSAITTILILDS